MIAATKVWVIWIVLTSGWFGAFEVTEEACRQVAMAVAAGEIVQIEDDRGVLFPIARAICLPPVDQRPCEGEPNCEAPGTGPTS